MIVIFFFLTCFFTFLFWPYLWDNPTNLINSLNAANKIANPDAERIAVPPAKVEENPLDVGYGQGQVDPGLAEATGQTSKIIPGTSETFAGTTPDAPGPNLFDRITGSVGEAIFPGFTDDAGKFSFGKALRTIGAATTIREIVNISF